MEAYLKGFTAGQNQKMIKNLIVNPYNETTHLYDSMNWDNGYDDGVTVSCGRKIEDYE